MLTGTVSQVPLKNNGISEAVFCAVQTGAATSPRPPSCLRQKPRSRVLGPSWLQGPPLPWPTPHRALRCHVSRPHEHTAFSLSSSAFLSTF